MTSRACPGPWLVLALCCVLNFNAMGLTFGMGAIFTDIVETFRVSRTTASLVQSVCAGVSFGIGIVTSHFVKLHGHRAAAMTGSVLACVGYFSAYWAPHISLVIVSIGVVAGVGISFIHLSTADLLVTGHKFHGKESLALTVFSVSSSVGSFVYPMILRQVIHYYSLYGTFLIQAAIFCQMILFGALIGLCVPRTDGKTDTIPDPTQEGETTEEADVAVDDAGDEERRGKPQMSSDGDEGCRSSVEESRGGESTNLVNGEDEVHDAIAADGDDGPSTSCRVQDNLESPREETVHLMSTTEENDAQNPRRSTSFAGGRNPETVQSFESVSDETSNGCCSTFRNTLHHQREVMRHGQFVIFAIFGPTTFLFFTQPMMFMTDMVKSSQMTVEDGSLFLTVMFAGSVAGRLVSGLLHHYLKHGIHFVNGVSIVLGGLSCLFYTFAAGYPVFIAVSLVFGCSYGLFSNTLPMVILEILGRPRFVVGLGSMATIACPFIICAGPYGGLIRDLNGSYELVYYIAGVHGPVIGLLLIFTAIRFHHRS